ncbi:Pseudouridine synthase RsuA/RluB/C/D/E/F [Trinorchestia longiramus]|nr:Pseudouridine synthase RsuA/RluB/C/D/E/F [Trinorchestia longiramus]
MTGNGYYPARHPDGLKVELENEDFLMVNKDFDLHINSDNPDVKVTLQTQLEHRFPALINRTLGHHFYFCHRLDYATSGVLCVAKHKQAAALMSAAMSARVVTKVYVALVRCKVLHEIMDMKGTIGEPLDPALAALRVCVDCGQRQRHAHTRLLLLQTGLYCGEEVSKVLLLAVTGRRHQLRAHCCSRGHVVVGDYTYSNRRDCAPHRMMSHAYHFSASCKGRTLTVTTEDPFSESALEGIVSPSGPYRPPGGVEEMQGVGRRVRLEWGAYITV